MKISSQIRGDILALTLEEARLDAAGALPFKERVKAELAGHDGRVVLDMAQVSFLDSSGLGALVAGMKMLDAGRRLELARCGVVVAKVLKLTRMDTIFVLHDTLPWAHPDADAA